MTIPTNDPALDPSHDCDEEYSPLCVDECADPCECGCNDEPDSPNGIMVVQPDGTERAATNKEAALWARHMVKAGILPRGNPMILITRRLRRRDLTRLIVSIVTAALCVGIVAALAATVLTATETCVLLGLTALGWFIWRSCRP
jgi:hypothetical protein